MLNLTRVSKWMWKLLNYIKMLYTDLFRKLKLPLPKNVLFHHVVSQDIILCTHTYVRCRPLSVSTTIWEYWISRWLTKWGWSCQVWRAGVSLAQTSPIDSCIDVQHPGGLTVQDHLPSLTRHMSFVFSWVRGGGETKRMKRWRGWWQWESEGLGLGKGVCSYAHSSIHQ